jgi:hypothetical protein
MRIVYSITCLLTFLTLTPSFARIEGSKSNFYDCVQRVESSLYNQSRFWQFIKNRGYMKVSEVRSANKILKRPSFDQIDYPALLYKGSLSHAGILEFSAALCLYILPNSDKIWKELQDSLINENRIENKKEILSLDKLFLMDLEKWHASYRAQAFDSQSDYLF